MKKQKVTHLTQEEWVEQRPETFFGAFTPAVVHVPVFSEEGVVWEAIELCPALLVLLNELYANAQDNAFRDGTQTRVRTSWSDGVFKISNDGSTLSVVDTDERTGLSPISLAFGMLQSGSNFNTEDGQKECLFTSGRNGIGAKGCNMMSSRFKVTVHNAEEGKCATQTWENGMKETKGPKVTSSSRKTNETVVEWTPDLSRLGSPPDDVMRKLVQWFSHNASLCVPDAVKVSHEGSLIKLRTPSDFAKALGGEGPYACDEVGADPVRLRICVCEKKDAGVVHAFVNSTPCSDGSHARYLLQKVAEVLQEKVSSSRDGKEVNVTPSFVAKHACVVAVCMIPDPRFTTQDKKTLDLPVKDWGWRWEPGEAFRRALDRSSLVKLAIQEARDRSDLAATKASKASSRQQVRNPKYEPATQRKNATLIITEGDSAKSFVVAGLSVLGRKLYGVYPIRGKFPNVRGESKKTVMAHKEASEILQILGIQLGVEYDAASAAKALPYRHVMICSDQDVDGSHIAGLLVNFLDVCAPSVLRAWPDFVVRFATFLVRAGELGFYSEAEYRRWAEEHPEAARKAATKYFKGLGTSTADMAKSYFAKLAEHTIVFRHTGDACGDALSLAFAKARSDERKAFLLRPSLPAPIDYRQAETTAGDFVLRELLPEYARAAIERAIPFVGDGMVPARRKILFGFRKLGITKEMSVQKAAGKVASETAYHHRTTAMEDAIVGMAADYAGCPNLNLLLPLGQFGTRHNHTAASAAYPMTKLNSPLHERLFPCEDDPVLEHVHDEGASVEPTGYAPVMCSALCFGSKGVSTGWSTDCPKFHPRNVLEATRRMVQGKPPPPPLQPWYRGFDGDVALEDAGVWRLSGKAEWKGEDVHVTEVPPMCETDTLREGWSSLCEDGIRVGDEHTDRKVHLILRKFKSSLEALNLSRKVTFHNVHFLDRDGRIRKYATPEEVVRDHYEWRREVYARRREHKLRALEREAKMEDEKLLFVTAVVEGTLQLHVHTDDATLVAAIREVVGGEGDYDHLLRMHMRSMTASKIRELTASTVKKRETLERYRRMTLEEEWLDDLLELEAVLPV